MARDTSRLTRACEIASSRRPSSQIGSETLSEIEETFRALGKKLSSNRTWVPTSETWGRYWPRWPWRNDEAARSLARAARYCGPWVTASRTASSTPIGSSGASAVSTGSASTGPVSPMRRPSWNRATRSAASRRSWSVRAWVSSRTSWSESLCTAAPETTRARAIPSPSSARRVRSAATRESSWFCKTA